MTLHSYAKLKQLPVTAIRVVVRHAKVHELDCEKSDTDPGARIDRLERQIWIDGDVPDATRARLLEIADRCPVHRTLHGTIRIVTRAE